jgi:lipase
MAELNAHTSGPDDGPPILAIHGVTGHGQRYDRIAREALPGHRIVAVDLRGHGRSTWLPPWHAEQHVQDLLDTLDANGLQRVTVVGHSFGGLLATHLARTAPERVERIALLDPAIALAPEAAAQYADEQRNPPSWASVDQALAARRDLRPPQGYADSDADVHAHLQRGADGRFRFRFAPAAAVVAWSEMARPAASLAGLDVPTLLVRAAQADFVSDAVVDGLRADLGDAFALETLDASHMLYWDSFDETAAALRRFLGA